MRRIHIGKKIKKVLDNSEITKVEFAKRLGITRTVAYNIFERKSINTALLARISLVLRHDFFKHYSETLKSK